MYMYYKNFYSFYFPLYTIVFIHYSFLFVPTKKLFSAYSLSISKKVGINNKVSFVLHSKHYLLKPISIFFYFIILFIELNPYQFLSLYQNQYCFLTRIYIPPKMHIIPPTIIRNSLIGNVTLSIFS